MGSAGLNVTQLVHCLDSYVVAPQVEQHFGIQHPAHDVYGTSCPALTSNAGGSRPPENT